jgi:hypothetical protein
MTSQYSMETTRRRFLLMTAVGGTAVVVGPLAFTSSADEKQRPALGEDTALIRNPAFSQHTDPQGPVLRTTTKAGKEVAYRMDSEGAFLWAHIPTAEEHLQGKTITMRELLDLAVREYGARDSSARSEALAFLKQAVEAKILVDPSMKIYVAFKPARR